MPELARSEDMHAVLATMRMKQSHEGAPDDAARRERLGRALSLLQTNRQALIASTNKDFGSRSVPHTLLGDLLSSERSLSTAIANCGAWMTDEVRRADAPFDAWGGTARIVHQSKGVVGVMGPWNYPVSMIFQPLAGALAAGNRVMLKLSELTPNTSAILAKLIAETFRSDEIAAVRGGPEIGEVFSRLPFDHLFFTGSGSVGRRVLAAAAENLTPVTLELGGKSPVIVSRSAELDTTIERIVAGKLFNGGQTCIAPDYLLVPDDLEGEIVDRLLAAARKLYPDYGVNPDATAVLTARHLERLQGAVHEARTAGAVVDVADDAAFWTTRLMPLHVVRGAPLDVSIMTDEIFGPVLPLIRFRTIDDAIAHVNAGDRPLALYYFGRDEVEDARVVKETISGGVTVNDVFFHFACEDLPFGGVGASGMGCYHGIDGFRTFSHARAVYRQKPEVLPGEAMFRPPYGAHFGGAGKAA